VNGTAKAMRVLVACEFSGRVRDAFTERGHDAVSCDFEPSLSPNGKHYQGDVRDILGEGWDMLIAFPPCTYLSNLNALHGRQGGAEEDAALDFVCDLMNADIPRIAIENPLGAINRRIRKPDQLIQPYYFGDPFQKRTYLWLKNLPTLTPTSELACRPRSDFPSWVYLPGRSRKNRSAERSMTFPGVAAAMAAQWG
jgi:hypothetical protein